MEEYKLSSEIIKLSNSKNWEDAKLEWKLQYIYEDNEVQTCLCGHYPIKEICVLKNELNNVEVNVGNFCVNRFIGIETEKYFQSAKKLHKNIEKSMNVETLQYLHEKKLINEKSYNFYVDIIRKRKLSPPQIKWKIDINNKYLNHIKKKTQILLNT